MVMELVQERRIVLKYSNELTTLWNEIDFCQSLRSDLTAPDYMPKGRNLRM